MALSAPFVFVQMCAKAMYLFGSLVLIAASVFIHHHLKEYYRDGVYLLIVGYFVFFLASMVDYVAFIFWTLFVDCIFPKKLDPGSGGDDISFLYQTDTKSKRIFRWILSLTKLTFMVMGGSYSLVAAAMYLPEGEHAKRVANWIFRIGELYFLLAALLEAMNVLRVCFSSRVLSGKSKRTAVGAASNVVSSGFETEEDALGGHTGWLGSGVYDTYNSGSGRYRNAGMPVMVVSNDEGKGCIAQAIECIEWTYTGEMMRMFALLVFSLGSLMYAGGTVAADVHHDNVLEGWIWLGGSVCFFLWASMLVVERCRYMALRTGV